MKHITKIATLLFLLIGNVMYGQSISNYVISSYVISSTNATAQMDATIGEPIVKTISNANNTLTQGFHQTQLLVTIVNENEIANNYQFYPNPVNEVLNFDYTNTLNQQVSIQLLDMNGKILYSKKQIQNNEQISFHNKANGQYLLRVMDENNKEIKTYKIIKK